MSKFTDKRQGTVHDMALIELYPSADTHQRNRERWITRDAMERARVFKGVYTRTFKGKVVQVTSERETPWVVQ